MNNLYQRILILTPTGKDATMCRSIFGSAKIECESVADIEHLCKEINAGAGAIVLTEEAVEGDHSEILVTTLRNQPAWSDIPIMLMTRGGADSRVATSALEEFGDIVLLERPVRVNTLISTCRAALKTRARQILLREKSEQLLEQTETLFRSNLELEQFAYVSSHDLQEPLRKISVYADLLCERYGTQLDRDGKHYLTIISEGSRSMSDLVRNLLSYARLTKVDKPMVPVDLTEVLKRVLGDLELSVKEKAAIITHDPLPVVLSERNRFHHVFLNLVSNALKFRSDVPPQIHISSQVKENVAKISIRDNGIGIDPLYADRIFQIFQRLHSKARYPGTGMGLAICKKIIEHHGGKIWVESKPGQGATFYFTVPVVSHRINASSGNVQQISAT